MTPPPLPAWATAAGFSYPAAYLRALALCGERLSPWALHTPAKVVEHTAGLAERYPRRQLLPFARRRDGDDVACFEPGAAHEVALIHDYATPGWEGSGGCSFREWFLEADEEHLGDD